MTDIASIDSQCQLVSLRTTDRRVLHGALYRNGPGKSIASILYLHGKGGNFYSGPGRFVPSLLQSRPIVHLSLNLRSHDLAYTRDDALYEDFERGSTKADGGYWEDLDTGIEDIRAGVDFLLGLTNVPIFVVGPSSGGFYSALDCAQDSRIAGQVLLSSVLDNKRSLPFWFPASRELEQACGYAKQLVERGEGRTLIPLRRWYYAISAKSLLQRAAQPDGVWIDAVQRSRAALLLAWGASESRSALWDKAFDDLPNKRKWRLPVPGADHYYVGHEKEVAIGIAKFVSTITSAT